MLNQTPAKYARDMAHAHVISASATSHMSEISAKAYEGTKARILFASFMSLAFSVLLVESWSESVPTTRTNVRRMEICINQNFMTIFRVSCGA